MVKEYFVKEVRSASGLLGTFIDKDDYDLLITEDADVYIESSFGDPRSEENVLLKFRKNYFPKELTGPAYQGFRDGATASHNRGIAAGQITDAVQKQSPDAVKGRGWVTEYNMAILNFFMQPAVTTLFEEKPETLETVRERYKDSKNKVSGARDPLSFGKQRNEKQADGLRGFIWLEEKLKANNFDFDTWADETALKSKDDQISEARWVFDEFVSGTNYATPVFSGVAGYYDRYPRIPFCRATSYTAYQKEKYEKGIPFIEELSRGFKTFLPERYGQQLDAINKLDPEYRIGKSVYTTLTLNKNFRTAVHTDSGDLPYGFGNLTCLSEKGWEGAHLTFPEFRVAVDIRVGDLLLMDVHRLHGNTPIKGIDGEAPDRISIVAYFRENMFGCSAKKYEDVRAKFVDYRRNDKGHKEWRENWNGISPSMWDSQEWYDYIRATEGEDFLKQFHPEAFAFTLDAFFEQGD